MIAKIFWKRIPTSHMELYHIKSNFLIPENLLISFKSNASNHMFNNIDLQISCLPKSWPCRLRILLLPLKSQAREHRKFWNKASNKFLLYKKWKNKWWILSIPLRHFNGNLDSRTTLATFFEPLSTIVSFPKILDKLRCSPFYTIFHKAFTIGFGKEEAKTSSLKSFLTGKGLELFQFQHLLFIFFWRFVFFLTIPKYIGLLINCFSWGF